MRFQFNSALHKILFINYVRREYLVPARAVPLTIKGYQILFILMVSRGLIFMMFFIDLLIFLTRASGGSKMMFVNVDATIFTHSNS